MAAFRAVLIEHGYSTTRYERDIIEAAGGELIDADHLPLSRALELCEEADGIFCRRLLVPAELLDRFRRCRVIMRYGVGTDNIDVDAATARGIIVGHVPSYGTDEVSSHAVALFLACARRVVSTDRRLRTGGWDVRRGETIRRVAGQTFAVVGLGAIGRAVVRKLQGWGMRIIAADPFADARRAAELNVELLDLETVCREADVISLHCPLLPETHHLIGDAMLRFTRPETILVNTSRGPVVDQKALLAALDEGRLCSAALDVFEDEPLPVDSPVRSRDDMVITDHTAWYSEESQVELQKTAAGVVAGVCTGGLPASLANPEVLARLGRWNEWQPAENMLWQLRRLEALGRPIVGAR
jgi:D-3-phosphoglycerate dehydrogenase / 2-oxoglutarate reductase